LPFGFKSVIIFCHCLRRTRVVLFFELKRCWYENSVEQRLGTGGRGGRWDMSLCMFVVAFFIDNKIFPILISKKKNPCSVWVARRPPGYAFVEFDDRRDAIDAIRALDGLYIFVSCHLLQMQTLFLLWKF